MFLGTPRIFAADVKKLQLSLSDCLDIGLANNLDIKIAKIESEMKKGDVLIAKSVFDAVLEGKVTYEKDERDSGSTIAGTKSITNEYEAGITKTLPTGTEVSVDYSNTRVWTDSIFAANNPLHTGEISVSATQPVLKNFFGFIDRSDVKLSKIEVEKAGLEALDRIENKIADIENAYWDLVFAYEDLALKEELLGQAEKLFDIFQKHLVTGLAETTETYETEANVRIRKTELAIARNNLVTASNNLLLLLNKEGDSLVLPTQKLLLLDLKADLARSLNEAFAGSRAYRVKKKNLEAKKIKVKMKANSLWPEIDLVGTYAVNGVDRKFEFATGKLTTDKYPYYYAGVEVSVPLENNYARGEYKKAALEKQKAILELVQVEKDLINAVDEQVREVNLALENATRWEKIKKIQYLKFQEEEKKIKYGRSNSKMIIDYQNDLTLAVISEHKAVLDYYSALINLENAKDMLLEKVGLVDYENI